MGKRLWTRAGVALAAGAAAVTLTGACDAVSKAIDCGQLATRIAADVDQLQEAVSGAGENPQAAADALNEIDKNLDDFGDQADNADVGKAVDDLQRAVDNAQQATDRGEVPDFRPVGDAAGELTNVCTS
ncbi:hypothetical protein DMB38_10810 [Streptomyces sp. WAC 06738]|uniref:hypothetical protein n=1 Tax=Streptomyces sp. WAC 06738 TaxID=2203210 RepID=UPI000F6E4179|nr:hypothetical protein [Streptomyces sp. WAC 06738]AZM46239.1 hypothetical protein DMB38_10810 [Streptomyces sp. WAC 06738]